MNTSNIAARFIFILFVTLALSVRGVRKCLSRPHCPSYIARVLDPLRSRGKDVKASN
jgi:hypothetical protein